MRGARSLLILVVVAGVLGGYLYYDSKHAPSDQKKLDKVFSGVTADKIDQLTVKSAAGDRTTAKKESGGWQLTQPVTAPADDTTVSGITSSLGSLEVQRVVEDQPTDLKQYGLDPPRIEVHFSAGGKAQTLLLGEKTPTGSDLYAKLPDQARVFEVASYLEATFNKTAFDFRDKTVLKVDRDKVDRLDIQTADRTLAFAKQGNDWNMTSPVATRADFSAIENVIGRLNTATMKSITAENPTDLKEYGLDKPVVSVHLGSGSAQAGLIVGKTAGDGAAYAKDLSRPMVFTVDSTLLDDLKKGPDDYRVKDLFDARSFNTTRVEIARGGTTTAYDRDKDAWKQVVPSAKAADTPKIDALVTALTGTQASSFVDTIDGTGLDKPDFTVTLKYEEGQKQDRVSFVKHGSDAFAQRDGDKGAAKIDPASLDAITKALDAVK